MRAKSTTGVTWTTARSGGWLLVAAGGTVAALGSLASMALVAAASSAVPGNYLGTFVALALGGASEDLPSTFVSLPIVF